MVDLLQVGHAALLTHRTLAPDARMLIQSCEPTATQPPRHRSATVGLRSRSRAGMGQVFLIAVVSALDAGLLTASVVLLGRPRPARQLGAYLIGGIGLSIMFGLLIVLALHGSNLRLGRSTQGVIELAASVVLILIAVAEWSGRKMQWHPRRARKRDADRSGRQSLHDRALGRNSLWIAWAAGALYSAPGAYYLAGLALLAKQNVSATTNVLVILGFNLIQFAVIELPLLGLVLIPDRTRSLTEKLNDWMTAHRRIVIVGLPAAATGTAADGLAAWCRCHITLPRVLGGRRHKPSSSLKSRRSAHGRHASRHHRTRQRSISVHSTTPGSGSRWRPRARPGRSCTHPVSAATVGQSSWSPWGGWGRSTLGTRNPAGRMVCTRPVTTS